MREKRPARQAMQHLGRVRVHALTQTCGENDDIHEKRREFSRMRDVSTAAKPEGLRQREKVVI
jgi:hypothetical protein